MQNVHRVPGQQLKIGKGLLYGSNGNKDRVVRTYGIMDIIGSDGHHDPVWECTHRWVFA